MVSTPAWFPMSPTLACYHALFVLTAGGFDSPEVQLNQQDLEMDSDDEAQVGES